MKNYIFTILLGCTSAATVSANNPIEIVQAKQSSVVSGKYQLIKEQQEIIKNGKIIEKSTSNLKDGNIYNFKSKDLVTIFSPNSRPNKGINFKIKQKGNSIDLINTKGEAEDDYLILKKNSASEVILVRNMEDGDEEGTILVRSTLYLKSIK